MTPWDALERVPKPQGDGLNSPAGVQVLSATRANPASGAPLSK